MNNFTKQYYDRYWKERMNQDKSDPIPGFVPAYLKKYTAYGVILSLIPRNSEVLDLGCGDGNVANKYQEKGDVTGIDVSEIALASAQKKGIKTIRYDLNATPYPLPSKTFDIIIMTDVLEHLLDPKKVLTECRRLLKHNGSVIITVPNFARIANRLRMIIGDPTDLLHFEKYGDELEHLHWFTLPKMTHLLTETGFKKIRYHATGLKNLNFLFGLLGFPNLGQFLTVTAS